jgi:hypothetical protein
MIVDPIGHRPSAYTLLTSRASLIDAAAQRATRFLTTPKKSARERSELATWEGEGGAAKPRTDVPAA